MLFSIVTALVFITLGVILLIATFQYIFNYERTLLSKSKFLNWILEYFSGDKKESSLIVVIKSYLLAVSSVLSLAIGLYYIEILSTLI